MKNKDKLSFTLINIFRNIVSIYFDTFFAIYFFNLVNYEILPLSEYYLIVFIVLVLSFWILKKAMKNNLKVSYYRIGLAFTSLYIASIMLLKDKIPDYIVLVAILKGLGEGFYYYPRNILNIEKIGSSDRRKYDGLVTTINNISSILMPIILGLVIDKFGYIKIGKIVFVLMIVNFTLSFFVKEKVSDNHKCDIKSFFKRVFKNKKIREVLTIQFLRGFTISSGVLTVVMTIYKILYFKTNSGIGTLNSILGAITCLASFLYATKISKKSYRSLTIVTICLISCNLALLAYKPCTLFFITYLVIYAIGLTITSLMADTIIANKSNDDLIKDHVEEYQLVLETVLGISRVTGYVVLLLIGIFGNIDMIKYILVLSIIPLILMVVNINNNLDEII